MHITVANPDSPFDSPAYDGPADQAHTVLAPGGYDTTDPDVALLVTDGRSIPVAVVNIDKVYAAVTSIPLDDLSTVRDRDAWTTEDGQTYTNPGIYGWKIITTSPRRHAVTGLFDGQEGHWFGEYPTFEAAMETVAYSLGA